MSGRPTNLSINPNISVAQVTLQR